MSSMNLALKRKKSAVSQVLSISAWKALFDCPSMVAAFRMYRYFEEMRLAILWKMAARSSQGVASQSFLAAMAAAIAMRTSASPAS